MARERVLIDINTEDAQGLTRVKLERASGRLFPGQIVTAYESDDSIQALAYVTRVDETTGWAMLAVNWDTLTDDDGSEIRGLAIDTSYNRAAAAAANSAAENSTSRSETRSSYVRIARRSA